LEEIVLHLQVIDGDKKEPLIAVLANVEAEAKHRNRQNRQQRVEFSETFIDDLEGE